MNDVLNYLRDLTESRTPPNYEGWRMQEENKWGEKGLEQPAFDPVMLAAGALASPVRAAAGDFAASAPNVLSSESGQVALPRLFRGVASPGKMVRGSWEDSPRSLPGNVSATPSNPAWFADDPAVAEAYANKAAYWNSKDPKALSGETPGGQAIIPANVSADKVFDLTALPARTTSKDLLAHLDANGVNLSPEIRDNFNYFNPNENISTFRLLERSGVYPDIAKSGYNSVKISDIAPNGAEHTSYGVFDPSLINAGNNMSEGGIVMSLKNQAKNKFMFARQPKATEEIPSVPHMADGGEVKENPIVTALRAYVMGHGGMAGEDQKHNDNAQAVDASSETAKGYAAGGPVAPALSDIATSLNTTPDTNYDFYRNMSADDRLAMQKQLIAKQNSGGNLVAQGAAGVGDAIARSFGGQNTDYQKGVMENAQKNTDNTLGGVDTYRAQKPQDMNASMEMQGNDPNSPLSQSFRAFVEKTTGQKMPSKMPANIGLKALGSVGELAMKQATLGIQQQIANANQANQGIERRQGAAKILADRPWYQKAAEMIPGVKSDATKEAQSELAGQSAPVNHGVPDLGATFNGGKVLKVTRVK